MGSPGTPSVAALTTITSIATITVLTTGLVTQCHLVLDTVLDAVLGHHAMLSHPASLTHHLLTCQEAGSQAQGRCREMGPGPPLATFVFPRLGLALGLPLSASSPLLSSLTLPFLSCCIVSPIPPTPPVIPFPTPPGLTSAGHGHRW